jgi:hypothetical protein
VEFIKFLLVNLILSVSERLKTGHQ